MSNDENIRLLEALLADARQMLAKDAYPAGYSGGYWKGLAEGYENALKVMRGEKL